MTLGSLLEKNLKIMSLGAEPERGIFIQMVLMSKSLQEKPTKK